MTPGREIAAILKNTPQCLGYEKLTFTSTAVGLTPPANASFALCVLESSVTTSTSIVARFLETSTPTSTTGIPLNHLAIFTLVGAQNIAKFKIIQAQAGTHTLTVEYF